MPHLSQKSLIFYKCNAVQIYHKEPSNHLLFVYEFGDIVIEPRMRLTEKMSSDKQKCLMRDSKIRIHKTFILFLVD